jgi:hypothetical protein
MLRARRRRLQQAGMKILVISQWFPGAGRRPGAFPQMAQAWASRGPGDVVRHSAELSRPVLLSWGCGARCASRGTCWAATIHHALVHLTDGGAQPITCERNPSPDHGALRRIPADVVVGFLSPLFAARGQLLAAAHRAFPSSSTSGISGPTPSSRSARCDTRWCGGAQVDRAAPAGAGAVVVVSPASGASGTTVGAVEVITNGADLQRFQPGPSDAIRRSSAGTTASSCCMRGRREARSRPESGGRDAATPFLFVLMGRGKGGPPSVAREAETRQRGDPPVTGPCGHLPVGRQCLVSLNPIPFHAFIPSRSSESWRAAVDPRRRQRAALELVLQAEAGLR